MASVRTGRNEESCRPMEAAPGVAKAMPPMLNAHLQYTAMISSITEQRSLHWIQVVCFLPPESIPATASARQWLLFDSHPRPQLGLAGASVRSFAGEDTLVEALNDIFPAIDLGTDNVMASMYNMFDAVPLSMKHEVER